MVYGFGELKKIEVRGKKKLELKNRIWKEESGNINILG
jgi:hypothetical protein